MSAFPLSSEVKCTHEHSLNLRSVESSARAHSEHRFPTPCPNSARIGYATEGGGTLSAQLSTEAVSAIQKVWVLIRLWKQHNVQLSKHAIKHEARPPQVKQQKRKTRRRRKVVLIQTSLVLFLLVLFQRVRFKRNAWYNLGSVTYVLPFEHQRKMVRELTVFWDLWLNQLLELEEGCKPVLGVCRAGLPQDCWIGEGGGGGGGLQLAPFTVHCSVPRYLPLRKKGWKWSHSTSKDQCMQPL